MRSYLFAPASDGRLVAKALASDADVVVLDLEDAVVAEDRGEARRVLQEHARVIAERPTHLRIGWSDGGYALEDVELAKELGVDAIRIPKAEGFDMLEPVLKRLGGDTAIRIHPTIESALGLSQVPDVIDRCPQVERFVFGERDFMADVGVDDAGPLTDHARAELALASRAGGLLRPIDGAYIQLDDLDGLRRSTERAVAFGFWGKSAIHPRQLPVIHGVFTHSPERVAWAERVTSAYRTALDAGRAVAVVDGTFVDAAVVRRATEILGGPDRG